MARWREAGSVYKAAELFRERCLSEETSFLWPEREAWSEENISSMWEAFVDSPDEGERTFFEKWQDQLAEEPEDVHRIAADMLAFYYLFPTNIGFDKKMANLRRVIGWKLSDDFPNLDLVEDAFGAGVGIAGMLYNTKMPWQMIFYLQFFGEIFSDGLDPHDVEVCRRLADKTRHEVKSSNPARNILLHLFFPERFERTASDSHKHRIAEAFRDMSGDAPNVDEALENIRAALVKEYGRDDLDFYDEDVRFRWDGLRSGTAATNGGAADESPTTEEYVAAFRATEELPGAYMKMLQIQYNRPRRAVTARQLSHAMGYEDYGAANLHYGKLGRLIGEALDRNPNRGWKVLATGERPAGEEFNWVMRPQVAEALEELGWLEESDSVDEPKEAFRKMAIETPQNTILFGPPGTGKTYSVQRKAVEIIHSSASNLSDEEIGEKFREFRDEGRIKFVTFHPSFSYEEFVEGFRYDPKTTVPTLHDGVFKEICGAADGVDEVSSESGGLVWKVSLGERGGDRGVFERCMENGEIAVGWLHGIDLTGENGGKIAELFREHHPGRKFGSTNRLVNEMREGDYVAVYNSRETIRGIGVVNGAYEYKEGYDNYHHVRPVRWLDDEVRNIHELNGNTFLVEETIYNLWRIPPSKLAALLPDTPEMETEKPYVLVIDEINRGNISRIFGELITLLEPDKRRGMENELSTRLPYSGENFSVPKNVHVIGTMNTADRSIALLDVALRRRFEFEEMLPSVDVVRKVLSEKEADVDVALICEVFEILNARITALLDRDHAIGHSYLLSATSPEGLWHALYCRVFPLLQEYFYNDPAQMRRLLGVYDPDEESGFIEKPKMEFGRNFSLDASMDDDPWSFHEYEVDEIEDALRRTFVGE